MLTILIVLCTLTCKTSVIIDAEELYSIKTLEECNLYLPKIIDEYKVGTKGYCIKGNILKKIEEA